MKSIQPGRLDVGMFSLASKLRELQIAESGNPAPVMFALGCSFLVFAAGSGCGKSGVSRIPGSGTVQVNGTLVDNFSIAFLPDQTVKSPSAETTVKNGKYQFTTQTGPASPGQYRVVIQEPVVPVPRRERNAKTVIKQKLWEFEFTVPEKGPFTKDFKLD